jgi:hypothetical protein
LRLRWRSSRWAQARNRRPAAAGAGEVDAGADQRLGGLVVALGHADADQQDAVLDVGGVLLEAALEAGLGGAQAGGCPEGQVGAGPAAVEGGRVGAEGLGGGDPPGELRRRGSDPRPRGAGRGGEHEVGEDQRGVGGDAGLADQLAQHRLGAPALAELGEVTRQCLAVARQLRVGRGGLLEPVERVAAALRGLDAPRLPHLREQQHRLGGPRLALDGAAEGPLRGPEIAALGGLGQQRLAQAGVGARGVDLLLGEAGELAQGGDLVAGVHEHAGAGDLDLDATREQAVGAGEPRVGLLEAALLDQREALQVRDPRQVLRQLAERGEAGHHVAVDQQRPGPVDPRVRLRQPDLERPAPRAGAVTCLEGQVHGERASGPVPPRQQRPGGVDPGQRRRRLARVHMHDPAGQQRVGPLVRGRARGLAAGRRGRRRR